jgi:hypothetical protein
LLHLSDQSRFDLDVLEKVLESSMMRIELGTTWKRGGEEVRLSVLTLNNVTI